MLRQGTTSEVFTGPRCPVYVMLRPPAIPPSVCRAALRKYWQCRAPERPELAFCAEHRHDIASLLWPHRACVINRRLPRFAALRKARRDIWRKDRIAGRCRTIIGPAALPAAPAIGGALGASALEWGTVRAAATSHGLWLCWVGAIASGDGWRCGGRHRGLVAAYAAYRRKRGQRLRPTGQVVRNRQTS